MDVDVSAARQVKLKAISLDILKELPISDYQDASEVKIKKPKKKKAKSTRQKQLDDDDVFQATTENAIGTNGDAMDVDLDIKAPAPKRQKNSSFIDDEDLQASLAKQRREALKKRKKMRPEDLARQLREEASATPKADAGDATTEDGRLILDETSEFVANLQRPEPERPKQVSSAKNKIEIQPSVESPPSEDEDVDMGRSYNGLPHEEMKQEESAPSNELTETGLDQETTVGSGLAATLNLVRDRGLLGSGQDAETNEDTRLRTQFQSEIAKLDKEMDDLAKRQRERDRASGSWDRMSARDRDAHAQRQNEERGRYRAQRMSEIMHRIYKPKVQLKYLDEFGRHMNQKEAFKELSHQFHGKGSGKQKTEKHLKKIKDEKDREARSALDSGLGTGMNNASQSQRQKNKQAGVRLA